MPISIVKILLPEIKDVTEKATNVTAVMAVGMIDFARGYIGIGNLKDKIVSIIPSFLNDTAESIAKDKLTSNRKETIVIINMGLTDSFDAIE